MKKFLLIVRVVSKSRGYIPRPFRAGLLILVFGLSCGFSLFGDTNEREELDFLLFLPNSGKRFEYEREANIQLDKVALYLNAQNILPGQILVSGYAAFVQNDIDALALSRERAAFVISELQKRGVSKELFAQPEAYGEVNLWGSNATENDRRPNRRVRILLDGTPLPGTPAAINPPVQNTPAAAADEPQASSFPWILIVFLALAAIIAVLLFARKKSKSGPSVNQSEEPKPPEISEPLVPAAAAGRTVVNLEEEIRLAAYEFYERRGRQNGFSDQDWFKALRDVSGRYIAKDYFVYPENGEWWASR